MATNIEKLVKLLNGSRSNEFTVESVNSFLEVLDLKLISSNDDIASVSDHVDSEVKRIFNDYNNSLKNEIKFSDVTKSYTEAAAVANGNYMLDKLTLIYKSNNLSEVSELISRITSATTQMPAEIISFCEIKVSYLEQDNNSESFI